MDIRLATAEDINRMVVLSEQMRTEYANYSPVFWHKAADAAEKQIPFFQAQLQRENNIVLVAEEAGRVEGFLIASIVNAPPVYDPGGLVCIIDDFTVSSPELWQSMGQSLLAAVGERVKERGAVLSVVVCGHLDQPKRSILAATGAEVASEWYVRPLS